MTASEVQQFPRPKDDCATFGRARDADASTSTEFEEPFIAQKAESTQNRVRVDTEDSGQVFGGRQPLAGARLSFGDGAPDLRSYLVMERQWVGSIDIDERDDAMYGSTMVRQALVRPVSAPLVGQPTSAEPVVVLIPEARQRQRNRHRAFAWFFVVVLVLGVLTYVLLHGIANSGRPTIPSPTAPTLKAVPAGVFAGDWSLHTSSLTITPDGRGSIAYPFDVRCGRGVGMAPFPCDVWRGKQIIDGGRARITLTNVGKTVATGMITHSDDQGIVPDGTVTFRLGALYGVPILYVTPSRRVSTGWLTHYLCSPAARQYYASHTDLTAPGLFCGA